MADLKQSRMQEIISGLHGYGRLLRGSGKAPSGRRGIFEMRKISCKKSIIFAYFSQKFKKTTDKFGRLDERSNCLGIFEKILKFFDQNSIDKYLTIFVKICC